MTGDLVEIEQEFFAPALTVALNLMYPLHRCLLPTDVARRLSIRLLEGKVHHALQKISNPQLSIISLAHFL